jgi:hypothetical protein
MATTPMTWIRQRRMQLNTPVAAPVVETHCMAFLLKGTLAPIKSTIECFAGQFGSEI